MTQHAWLAVSPLPTTARVAMGGVVGLLIFTLIGLMMTTPVDAILLPTRTSVLMLAAITAAAYGHLWLRTSGVATDALAMLVIIALVAVSAERAGRRGRSPWAAVVPTWVPLLTGPNAVPPWQSVGLVLSWLVVFEIVTRRRD